MTISDAAVEAACKADAEIRARYSPAEKKWDLLPEFKRALRRKDMRIAIQAALEVMEREAQQSIKTGRIAQPKTPAFEDPKLDALVKAARERYEALSPEEKAAADKAQLESWLRGMKPTGDPRLD